MVIWSLFKETFLFGDKNKSSFPRSLHLLQEQIPEYSFTHWNQKQNVQFPQRKLKSSLRECSFKKFKTLKLIWLEEATF